MRKTKGVGFCHKVIYKAVKVVAIFGAFKRTNRRTDAFKEVLADLKKHPVSLIYAHLGCFP